MSDFEHYKLLQKRIEVIESECEKCKLEFKDLVHSQSDNRLDIDKLILALFGDPEIGIVGILERFRETEQNLLRGRSMQLAGLGLSVLLSSLILLKLLT